MNDPDLAAWKKALNKRKRVHAVFVLLLVAAYACYAVGMALEAGLVFAVGLVLELASGLVLAADSSHEGPNGPRGGLR